MADRSPEPSPVDPPPHATPANATPPSATPADGTPPARPSLLEQGRETGQRYLDQATQGSRRALTYAAFGLGIVLALWIGWFLFGEWWVGVVRNRVDGSIFRGWSFGYAVGLLATLTALTLLRLVLVRRMWTWLRATVAVLAAFPLLPLAFSLRVQLNRVQDNKGSVEYQVLTDGRGYQTGVTLGVLTALVIIGLLVWWSVQRRRRRRPERVTPSGP